MSVSTQHQQPSENEATILARFLDDEQGQMPADLARYILGRTLNDRDKARMHELAVRNQDDGLTTEEKEELHAFAKAATLLSILKSKARRRLGITHRGISKF